MAQALGEQPWLGPHVVGFLVAELWNHPVRVKLVPDFSALVFTRATFESLGDVPLIGLREPAIDDVNRFIRQ